MARRRDVRRFGSGPYLLGLRRSGRAWARGSRSTCPPWPRSSGSGSTRRSPCFNIAAFIDGAGKFAPDLSLYGDLPLHEQSHGQSFLALAANRFGGDGLYVLDEPEAALSVSGALALLAIVVRASRAGAQFVIATHSPILLACPGAQVYELDARGIAPCAYDDLEAVRLTRGFLDAPARFIRAALEEED